MVRRNFFKSLVGLFMIPFAKQVLNKPTKRPSSISVEVSKCVPVRFDWTDKGKWQWYVTVNNKKVPFKAYE